LPVPGGPTSSRLWPPAAAISSARLAAAWPFHVAQVGHTPRWHGGRGLRRSGSGTAASPGSSARTTCPGACGTPRSPGTSAASAALACRQHQGAGGAPPAACAAPGQRQRAAHRAQAPASDSSPANSQAASAGGLDLAAAARMPSAIGRSKRPESLGRSAGARLTVMRLLCGKAKPALLQRRAHPLARFLHLGVGQAHQREAGQAVGQVHLHLHLGAARPSSARLMTTASDMAGVLPGEGIVRAASASLVRTIVRAVWRCAPIWCGPCNTLVRADGHAASPPPPWGQAPENPNWHGSCKPGPKPPSSPPWRTRHEKSDPAPWPPSLAATACRCAMAQTWPSTSAVVTDYRYRGISQTKLKPAVQGGVDYAAGGFYVGAWASTIKWIKDAAATPASRSTSTAATRASSPRT
jgi:hypothetical protein